MLLFSLIDIATPFVIPETVIAPSAGYAMLLRADGRLLVWQLG